jgi:hypothetical protein
MATKQILWKEKKDGDQQSTGEVHNEYLYNWGRLVKYRVVLSRYSTDSVAPSLSSSPLSLPHNQFVARLYSPSPPAPAPPPGPALSKLPAPHLPPSKINVYSITDWGMLFLP